MSAQAALSPPQIKISKSRHLVSGFTSGLVSAALLQPLDLLKTRVQQSANSTLTSSWNELLSPVRAAGDGSPDSLVRFVRRLWRGTLPSIMRTSIGSGLYFYTLHTMRTYIHDHDRISSSLDSSATMRSSVLPQIRGYANFLTGGLARGLVGFVMMPVTVLKVRYESSTALSSTLLQTAKTIYNAHGLAGFFYGFGVTFVRDAPYAGIYVWVYEYAKKSIPALIVPASSAAADGPGSAVMLSNSMSVAVNAVSATVAATAAVAATNPFDAVKTRMQLFPEKYGTKMWTTFRRMVQEDGVLGLFDGLGLRMIRKGLSSGIAWCVYEEIVRKP